MKTLLIKTPEVEETVKYWKDLIPKIWPTMDSKKIALAKFKSQLNDGTNYNSIKSIKARIVAFEILIKNENQNNCKKR